MNDESLNLPTRQFLKRFGVTAQREIERAIRARLDEGMLRGTERLPVRATPDAPRRSAS